MFSVSVVSDVLSLQDGVILKKSGNSLIKRTIKYPVILFLIKQVEPKHAALQQRKPTQRAEQKKTLLPLQKTPKIVLTVENQTEKPPINCKL